MGAANTCLGAALHHAQPCRSRSAPFQTGGMVDAERKPLPSAMKVLPGQGRVATLTAYTIILNTGLERMRKVRYLLACRPTQTLRSG